eukprot:11386549-Alexandrium_andersonii.AAC.1
MARPRPSTLTQANTHLSSLCSPRHHLHLLSNGAQRNPGHAMLERGQHRAASGVLAGSRGGRD